MAVERLEMADKQRIPKALTGNPAAVAAKIVDILKNEARVI